MSASIITAEDTAARAEAESITRFDAEAVNAFVAAFTARAASFLTEAQAYVAAVDARNGKRGADAAVQRVIAAGLPKGAEPYSPTRYSKLSAAFRALPAAGFTVTDAAGFDALYALWNVPSNKLSGEARDAVVAGASRRKSDTTRIAHIWDAIDAAKAGKVIESPAEETAETVADESPVTVDAATGHDVQTLLGMLATIGDAVASLTDAERVLIGDAAQALTDSIWESTSNVDAAIAEVFAA